MVRVHPSELHCDDGDLSRVVAVLAFKAVYTLEKNRRENDKRVIALYVEYVALNPDLSSQSHTPQNGGHDGSSPPVRLHFHILARASLTQKFVG